MNEKKPTPEQLQAILDYASKKLGVTSEQLAGTVKGEIPDKLKSRLSKEDTARFQAVVGDKNKLEKMLQSPQAKQLIEKILGNK